MWITPPILGHWRRSIQLSLNWTSQPIHGRYSLFIPWQRRLVRRSYLRRPGNSCRHTTPRLTSVSPVFSHSLDVLTNTGLQILLSTRIIWIAYIPRCVLRCHRRSFLRRCASVWNGSTRCSTFVCELCTSVQTATNFIIDPSVGASGYSAAQEVTFECASVYPIINICEHTCFLTVSSTDSFIQTQQSTRGMSTRSIQCTIHRWLKMTVSPYRSPWSTPSSTSVSIECDVHR